MLKTKYPGEPKYLEALYEEYAEEKRHVKLNQTQWRNVTQFGEHLKSVRNIQVIGNPPDCKVVYLVNNTSEFIERSKREKK